MTAAAELPIVFEFEPGELVDLCHDPAGIPIDLIEITGMRTQRDLGLLRRALREDIADCFTARPERRRLVVWSHAGWLLEHAPDEHRDVRAWLEAWLREIQNPWQLPLTGQVAGAVLQGELPEPLHAHRAVPLRDLDYEAERPPERRSEPRD